MKGQGFLKGFLKGFFFRLLFPPQLSPWFYILPPALPGAALFSLYPPPAMKSHPSEHRLPASAARWVYPITQGVDHDLKLGFVLKKTMSETTNPKSLWENVKFSSRHECKGRQGMENSTWSQGCTVGPHLHMFRVSQKPSMGTGLQYMNI